MKFEPYNDNIYKDKVLFDEFDITTNKKCCIYWLNADLIARQFLTTIAHNKDYRLQS